MACKQNRGFLFPVHRSPLGIAFSVVLVLVMVAGCGDRRPKRVPVSGQVLIDGMPLTRGYIRFVPDNARPASGVIGPDGRFTLMTFEPDDGAVTGKHAVSITCVEPLGDTARRWYTPKKYTDPNTSGLAVTIDGPTDSLVVKLTWDGGEPFVERDGDTTYAPLREDAAPVRRVGLSNISMNE